MSKTEIKFCGFDSWNRPVFTDRNGNLYVDINLSYPDLDGISLYTKCNNEFDSEPDDPVNINSFEIVYEFSDSIVKIYAGAEKLPDGTYNVFCIDEIFSGTGDTLESAKKDMEEQIKFYLSTCRSDNKPYPKWLDNKYEIVYI